MVWIHFDCLKVDSIDGQDLLGLEIDGLDSLGIWSKFLIVGKSLREIVNDQWSDR
jgi:hypothetical protein